MKKIVVALFTIAILSVGNLFAQDGNGGIPADDIQTLSGRVKHFGFYGSVGFRATSFQDKYLALAGGRFGIIANRTLGIGFEGYGIIPSASYTNLIPNSDIVPLGGYGGLTIEPILLSNKAVHFTFPLHAGAGWMGYVPNWSSTNYDYNNPSLLEDDIFWYVEPGANIEINISKIVRFNVGVSKRFVQDLSLTNTSSKDFSTLSYGFSLKVGRF